MRIVGGRKTATHSDKTHQQGSDSRAQWGSFHFAVVYRREAQTANVWSRPQVHFRYINGSMLDLAFVRDNLTLVEQKLRDRGMEPGKVPTTTLKCGAGEIRPNLISHPSHTGNLARN